MAIGPAFLFDQKSGGMGIRTPDIQLAKLALYQLSYTPVVFFRFQRGPSLARCRVCEGELGVEAKTK